jgi:hypothetical protein
MEFSLGDKRNWLEGRNGVIVNSKVIKLYQENIVLLREESIGV